MSLEDLGLTDYAVIDKTLIIDGDIIVYRPCCIYNEDDDQSRRLISKAINNAIDKLMLAAGCNAYIMFVTTKFNFRDQLVDDYKFNRNDVERPINLTYAKRWATTNLNTHYHKGLEADDLLGIHMTDNTVLWSLDKDLRQIPGKHLDDETQQVIEVTEEGVIEDRGKKVYFNGTIGLYFQMLTGDSTDHIVGCGKRVPAMYKSGAKKGQSYVKRQGVGPKAALNLLVAAGTLENALEVVIEEYKKIHGKDWQSQLETQANLLFMVRKQDGEIIQRWTYDGREEYFDLIKGVVINDSKNITTT
tara:strand:- start:2983 stop:3888 length:906 start_codon:yes stop_codon:yes gene_type:complete